MVDSTIEYALKKMTTEICSAGGRPVTLAVPMLQAVAEIGPSALHGQFASGGATAEVGEAQRKALSRIAAVAEGPVSDRYPPASGRFFIEAADNGGNQAATKDRTGRRHPVYEFRFHPN
jgi:hypothetical protein